MDSPDCIAIPARIAMEATGRRADQTMGAD
jgi:hypothetical protein